MPGARKERLWRTVGRKVLVLAILSSGAGLLRPGFAQLLIGEPPGLRIGKVRLADGEETLGVLGRPALWCSSTTLGARRV